LQVDNEIATLGKSAEAYREIVTALKAAMRLNMKLAALIRKQLMDLVEADDRERWAKAA